MAGQARYTALLDACVLYPLAMTDALLSLATAGLFAAKWTTRIEEEWIAALERQRPDLIGRLEVRRNAMREAVVDWEIPERAWRHRLPGITLPDESDVHVLAAALAGHVDCIVTLNLKDFPAEILDGFGVEVIHPDTFLVHQWDIEPDTAVEAFRRMRARRRSPSSSPLEFAEALRKAGLPMLAERLGAVAARI